MKTTRTSLFFVTVSGLLAICGPALTVQADGLIQDLISYWQLDEGSGITTHDFVGGNDGTIYGAEWTAGQVDGALVFDGIDDYVELGSPDSLDDLPLGNFTISAWIYDEYNAGTTWGTVIGCYAYDHGWSFRTFSNAEGDRFLTFEAPHSGTWVRYYSVDGTIMQNTWYHVAAVWDANTKTAELYIDGAEPSYQKTDAGTGTYNSDASRDKEIGRLQHVGGIHYVSGVIDEVAIFKRSLSAEEIQQIYERGLSGQGLPVERIIAIKNIERAIDEKLEALERIDAAIERERAALQTLNELPANKQLRGLGRADIIRAKMQIYQSLVRQYRCKIELRRSIDNLEGSLELLNSD